MLNQQGCLESVYQHQRMWYLGRPQQFDKVECSKGKKELDPFWPFPGHKHCTISLYTLLPWLHTETIHLCSITPLNKKSASCEFSSSPIIEFAEKCWHHHQFPQLPLNPLRSSSRKAFFGKTLASGFCSWNNQSVPIPIQHMSKWYSIVVNQNVNSFCLYPHRTSI